MIFPCALNINAITEYLFALIQQRRQNVNGPFQYLKKFNRFDMGPKDTPTSVSGSFVCSEDIQVMFTLV